MPGHRQAADRRARARQAAGAARQAGQAADRPLGLSQPRAQPRRRRCLAVEAPRRRDLRHRHDEPRPRGLRGGGTGGGSSASAFYPRSGFTHVDLGPARQWGGRFPGRATGFAAETPPARSAVRQPHHDGRRSGRCGDAGRGPRGGRAEHNLLAETETETAILPLVPYLDALRSVFISVALVWIAVTICARLDDRKRGLR
jgi:hypothetical protein